MSKNQPADTTPQINKLVDELSALSRLLAKPEDTDPSTPPNSQIKKLIDVSHELSVLQMSPVEPLVATLYAEATAHGNKAIESLLSWFLRNAGSIGVKDEIARTL